MKKFTLLLSTAILSVSSAFALELPTNGVYELQHYGNTSDSRGYMVQNESTNTLHPAESQLANYTSETYSIQSRTAEGWNSYWYLYTSTSGKSYIFSVFNGKFLAYESGTGNGAIMNLSDTPASLEISTSTLNSSYYQIKPTGSTYYVGNSIGWENDSEGHTVTQAIRLNPASDAAVPHAFNSASVEYNQEVIDAAIEKIIISEISQISQTYDSSAAFWTLSPVYPAGLNNSTEFTKDNIIDVASTHFGNDTHTLYKAVTPVFTNGQDHVVTFTYSTGNAHGLLMLGVDMVNESGEVVASDYHIGFTGGVHCNNTYTLSGVEAGQYMLRYYVCNKADDHDLTYTGGTITATGVAEISEASIVASMFNSLAEVADNDYIAKAEYTANEKVAVGYYSSAFIDPIKAAKDSDVSAATVAVYKNAFVALDDAMDSPAVYTMPEAGKFYRLKNVASSNYLSSTIMDNNRLPMVEDANGEKGETVWYYDGTRLVAQADGMVLGQFIGDDKDNSWKTLLSTNEKAGTPTFERVDFGKLSIQASSGRFIHGANDTSDCGNGASTYEYWWIFEDVTELPVYTGGQALFAVYSPVALNVSDGLDVYTCTISGSSVVTTKESLGGISANTAVLVKNPDETVEAYPDYVYFTLNYEAETEAAVATINETTALTGSIYATAATEGTTYYTLQNNTDYLDFMPKSDIIPGFTAQIADPSESAPAYYEITGDGKTTEIEEITVNDGRAQSVYDLQGRKLSAPVKGINIINGKKVLVK